MKICSIKSCNNKHHAKGLCQKHYGKTHSAEYKKQYYQNNKEELIKKAKQHRDDNKEQIAIKKKQYREKHKKHIAMKAKQYLEKNKKKLKEYLREYIQTPKARVNIKVYRHNRRALTKGLTKAIVRRVYDDNVKKYGRLTCYLCNKPIKFGDDSLDHSTPITRGGSNDYENFGIAHKSCNSRKHTMTLEEWNSCRRIVGAGN